MVTATLDQVAKRAGVAKSTASMALRNHPNLSKATRERVQRAARELGYRPNPSISALMTHIRSSQPVRTRDVIGFVSGYPTVEALKALPANRDSFEGARERAESLGYRMNYFSLDPEILSQRRLSDILVARGIRTLVFGPQRNLREAINLDWDQFSASVIGYSTFQPALHRAVPNDYICMHLAIKRLLQARYCRPGVVMDWSFDTDSDNQLSAAYLAFQYRHPEELRVPLMIVEDDEDFREVFELWFTAQRPDCVIAQDARVIPWLQEMGYRVPEDVGVASLSLPSNEDRISGICPHWYYVGAAAVDLAVAASQRNETGIPRRPKLSMVYGYWIGGETHQPQEGEGILRGRGFQRYMMHSRSRIHLEDTRQEKPAADGAG
ncbi:MAG: LacI family DNA-binding transcriptional regulator [Opitutales bacterium]